jgi:hypothetical protein
MCIVCPTTSSWQPGSARGRLTSHNQPFFFGGRALPFPAGGPGPAWTWRPAAALRASTQGRRAARAGCSTPGAGRSAHQHPSTPSGRRRAAGGGASPGRVAAGSREERARHRSPSRQTLMSDTCKLIRVRGVLNPALASRIPRGAVPDHAGPQLILQRPLVLSALTGATRAPGLQAGRCGALTR